MRPYSLNLKKLLTPEDYAMLQDKNRSVPGKSKIVPRVKQLAIEAKTDIEKRNYLFYMVIPFFNHMLKNTLHVQNIHFGDYYADCFNIFCESIERYNPEKSNNLIPLIKNNFRFYYINVYKSKRAKQEEVTTHIESFEPLVMEKYLKSFDEEFEFPTSSSGDPGNKKTRAKRKNGNSL